MANPTDTRSNKKDAGIRAYVRSTGRYIPEKRVSNDELAKTIETSDEWIYSHTGIHNRHIAAPEQAASDLALEAARSALERAGAEPDEIDLILVATTTPDYIGFPSTAAIVQDRLGSAKAGAMDISAACTGFIYAAETARCFIEAGSAENVLVIGAEIYSRIIDWTDRDICVLFGDGAGAVLFSKNTDHTESGIYDSILRAEGAGADHLKVLGGGGSAESESMDPLLVMDGRKVYNFAVRAVCDTVRQLLDMEGATVDDVSYIVPHQANIRILDAAAKRLGMDRDKFFVNIHELANTSAASIPIALNDMQEKDLLKRGDLILTVGFGGGLTYGGNIMRW